MADAVDTKVIYDGRFHVVHLQNLSDGTGEDGVAKVDISGLTVLQTGATCTYTSVYKITGNVWGGEVQLLWDHTTDDEIATLFGPVNLDWAAYGGNVDPQSSGGTGDILLTTTGFASGSGYDLTLMLLKKA